ncbi:hypothetical protein BLX88_05390 [Bacillus obstructivus]|nr:hypothetical protein BLX88_05390 [Bacillus obstructivus]
MKRIIQEKYLERYLIFMYLNYEERQASTTTHIDDIAGVRSNVIGYKTRLIGIDNVEEQQ